MKAIDTSISHITDGNVFEGLGFSPIEATKLKALSISQISIKKPPKS